MTSFGELLNALLGWMGEIVEWIISFIPRYEIIRINQRGVKFVFGNDAIELDPGLHWYWPWCTEIHVLTVVRDPIEIEPLTLVTKDKVLITIGLIVTIHITDVITYYVDNVNPDKGIKEVAAGTLRDIVIDSNWEDLCKTADDGKMLEKRLSGKMGKALEKFGVEVESTRPTDQAPIRAALRLFGDIITE